MAARPGEFPTEEAKAYQARVDMLENMDAGDAPIYVHNYRTGLSNLTRHFPPPFTARDCRA